MNARPDPSWVRFEGPWLHRDIRANGIRLHVVEAADSPAPHHVARTQRPLVLLLHGFAEFWWVWRHQLTALDELGYHAAAVDLRGYGDSDKPPRGYDAWTLAGDIDGLIRALGHSSAHVIGHGDGGYIGWTLAALHRDRVKTLVAVSAPHPRAIRHAIATNRSQLRAVATRITQYQIPRLPEHQLTADGGRAVTTLMKSRAGSRWAATDDFAQTAAKMSTAMTIPAVAHLALEYQRWVFRSQFRADGRRFLAAVNTHLKTPVLAVTGDCDPYVSQRAVDASQRWSSNFHSHVIREVGHYAPQETPEEFTDTVSSFINQHTSQ